MKKLLIAGLFVLVAVSGFCAGYTEDSRLPAGTIMMYAGDTAPTGWALCDGAIASDSALSAFLVTRLNRKYNLPGDDTEASTRLPDFRGVFPKGMGQNGHLGADYSGASGTPSLDKFQGHNHASSADARYNLADGANFAQLAAGAVYSVQTVALNPSTDGTNGVPRVGKITEPANVGVNFIIKL